MKYNRVISIAVLFLLLGTTIPAFAQKDDEKKGGGGGKPQAAQHEQQPQHAQKAARPQRAQKAQPQRAERAAPQHAQKAEPRRAEKAAPQRAQKAEPRRAEKAAPQRAQKTEPRRAERAAPQHAQKAEPRRAEKSAPQHAQKAEPQRAERAAPQHAQKAEPRRAERSAPQRAQKEEPQRAERAQQAQRQAQPSRGQQAQSVASNRGGGQYGGISNANYSAHFGQGHSFHMGHPQMIGGYNRFQYGGYSFGYNQEWPAGWGYDDNVYVEYVDGNYCMYDLIHPGMHISLNLFGNGNYGSHYGRISDVSYRSHFGHDHWFHMGRPEMIGGYNRFHYGGYWFGYNQEWPTGWDYNDDCYVAYSDGAYYMYNRRHPGMHITLRIFS